MEEFIYILIVFLTGITLLWAGFFYVTKKNYQNAKLNKDFQYINQLTPLPRVINFWLVKILYILSGLLAFLAGVYGFIYRL